MVRFLLRFWRAAFLRGADMTLRFFTSRPVRGVQGNAAVIGAGKRGKRQSIDHNRNILTKPSICAKSSHKGILFRLESLVGRKDFDSGAKGEFLLLASSEQLTRTLGELFIESKCVEKTTSLMRFTRHFLHEQGVAPRYAFPLALIIPPWPAQRFESF